MLYHTRAGPFGDLGQTVALVWEKVLLQPTVSPQTSTFWEAWAPSMTSWTMASRQEDSQLCLQEAIWSIGIYRNIWYICDFLCSQVWCRSVRWSCQCGQALNRAPSWLLNLFDLLPTASWDFLSRQPYLLMIHPISQPTSRETINQNQPEMIWLFDLPSYCWYPNF